MTWLPRIFSFRAKHDADAEKPFLDHLEDLRVTLMKMGAVLALAMIVAFCFKNQLTRLLEAPLASVSHSGTETAGAPAPLPTERERLLAELSSMAVEAAAKVMNKVLTPEEQRSISDSIYQAHKDRPVGPDAAMRAGKPVGTSDQEKLQVLDVTEPFTIALKLAFYAGIVISFPFQLYFVTGFVLPALTRKEKRLLGPGILSGSLLFAAGVVIGFHFILPKTLVWFHDFGNSMGFIANWKAGTYFSFVTQLCLACGLLCELPLVMIVLSVLNVISFSLLQATRRYAVAVILILVAIIAPTPDPITFLTLAIPMLAIYEGSIWVVWLIERSRRKRELSGQTLGD